MKSINTEEFFKLVAVNAGVTDLETVRDIFYGMVKTISRELKNKQIVKLPDWGSFALKLHKSRRSPSVRGGIVIIPPRAIISFTPDYKVKRYFYKFGEEKEVL